MGEKYSFLTEDEKKNILKLLKEKQNGAKVTKIVKRSEATVYRIAKENGIDLGKPGPKKATSSSA